MLYLGVMEPLRSLLVNNSAMQATFLDLVKKNGIIRLSTHFLASISSNVCFVEDATLWNPSSICPTSA